MQLEVSFTVKAVPMADCHLSIDCSAEELAIALADPVYQHLGEVLVAKLSQARHNENLRRKMEVMEHAMQILEKRIESFKKRNPGFD